MIVIIVSKNGNISSTKMKNEMCLWIYIYSFVVRIVVLMIFCDGSTTIL